MYYYAATQNHNNNVLFLYYKPNRRNTADYNKCVHVVNKPYMQKVHNENAQHTVSGAFNNPAVRSEGVCRCTELTFHMISLQSAPCQQPTVTYLRTASTNRITTSSLL